ncbi:MAG: hypothetical protein COA85_06120 [Robiginitomaculum sp.]|nr:MAG: hypothetical protein COA85_06120 [Robiginitomaculum sp.]
MKTLDKPNLSITQLEMEIIMKMYMSFGNLCRNITLTTLAVITLSGTAYAQDTFTVKIKRVAGESVGASYAAMETQAMKYCRREDRRVEDRISPIDQRGAYIQKCVDEVMGKVISQIKDSELTAYHAVKGSSPTLEASNVPLK